ncbi:MAG TPA: hypothetical protein VF133_12035 [Terriglobales bacterium]
MKNRKTPSFTRRKLATVTRKAISSYYSDEEHEEIVRAARRQRISISAFVASAALKDARRSNREHS